MSKIADFKTYTPKSTFKRTEFIKFSMGQHTIRQLTEKAVVHNTHYVHDITIKCLEDDCPICQNNKKMFMEFGRDAWKQKGFIGQRQVGYLNVLDRTPVKICPNTECQEEVKKIGTVFPPMCPKCGSSLIPVAVAPLNKVKVLAKGKKFFDQLEYYNASVLDETETPIGITNYDLDVLVLGEKVAPTVSARADKNDKVEVPEDALFDLEKAIVVLEPDEILSLLRGVKLGDIFKGRKAEVSSENNDVRMEVTEGINSVFEN